jgi:hypothetical protein
MALNDDQRAELAATLAEQTLDSMDGKSMERIVYDLYYEEYLMMAEDELLAEAEHYEVEVPSVVG